MSKEHEAIKTIAKLCLMADETHQGSELNDAIRDQCIRVLSEDELADIIKEVAQELGQ